MSSVWKSRIVKAVFLLALLTLAVGALFFLQRMWMGEKAGQPTPQAGGFTSDADGDGFPEVDWKYWLKLNPDIAGWITIPGTPVDYPIIQARSSEPEFYLRHDVNRDANPYGCIFIDAECDQGLQSQNCVIYGHHMADGSMGAALASYTDESWASEHSKLLIQTPDWKRALNFRGARVINGREESKRTQFAGKRDFEEYVETCMDACSSRGSLMGDAMLPTRMYTLCTCSYTRFDDERTLTYAW